MDKLSLQLSDALSRIGVGVNAYIHEAPAEAINQFAAALKAHQKPEVIQLMKSPDEVVFLTLIPSPTGHGILGGWREKEWPGHYSSKEAFAAETFPGEGEIAEILDYNARLQKRRLTKTNRLLWWAVSAIGSLILFFAIGMLLVLYTDVSTSKMGLLVVACTFPVSFVGMYFGERSRRQKVEDADEMLSLIRKARSAP